MCLRLIGYVLNKRSFRFLAEYPKFVRLHIKFVISEGFGRCGKAGEDGLEWREGRREREVEEEGEILTTND
jgi:hypothetical protein